MKTYALSFLGFWLSTLMLLLLSLASCTGCGRKATQEMPAPATPATETPTAPASPLYKDPNFPGISLKPWHPVVIPPAVKERERASYQHYEDKEISMDEHLENMYQLYREHLDGVTFVRELARRHGPYAGKYEFYLEKLLAENPNDFETLLTWVHAGGREFDTYG